MKGTTWEGQDLMWLNAHGIAGYLYPEIPTTPEEVADLVDQDDATCVLTFGRMLAVLGSVRANQLWQQGCEMYDIAHGAFDEPTAT